METSIQQAITAHEKGELQEAERLYQVVLKTQPTNLDVNNNLGLLLYSLDRFDEAAQSYKKVIELKPDYVEAHNNLGNILLKLKKLDEELEEKTYGETLVSKAKDLAKKFKDNMSKAVAEIEKLEIGLSKNSSVEQELRKHNEEVEEPKQDMPDDKEKVAKENSDKEIASLKDQIAMLKTKLENAKSKLIGV